ncbi:hypothetical protein RRG08_033540 [Elysia crispata]|uniref:Uncharacterized protein n=1 Tax=Elysia crispata TaxID=231223 RepID=A0AAE0XNU8_9GAST|nr:hypothetical protein RRG08_033540 [Elysia crispata]
MFFRTHRQGQSKPELTVSVKSCLYTPIQTSVITQETFRPARVGRAGAALHSVQAVCGPARLIAWTGPF